MKSLKENSGFSVVHILIVFAVIGIVGFVGFRVMNNKSEKKPTNTISSQPKVIKQTTVTSKEDLNSAVNNLKNIKTETIEDENALKQVVQ